jgi:putative hemolysin
VFAEEMQARLHGDEAGLDVDPFDRFCRHLIVRDRRNDEVVASMRMLVDEEVKRAGSFYSETEFQWGQLISAILAEAA